MPRAFTPDERANVELALKRAALESLQTGTMRRTSVEHLCRQAGISKGAFYAFFENKEQLVVSLLRDAEAELRAELSAASEGPDPLRTVLERLFTVVTEHPVVALLANPDDFAWLARGLGPGRMAEARADDDRWFRGLHAALVARGALDPTVSIEVFLGLPHAALVLAQGRTQVGVNRSDAVRDAIVRGLVADLGREPG